MTRAFRSVLLTISALLCVICLNVATPPHSAAAPLDPTARPGRQTHTTVLTCEPLIFGADGILHIMNTTFSRYAPTHGTPVRVPTVVDLRWAGLLRGRDLLNDYIRRTPGKKIVFGYSRGAQIASEWLRTYAGRADAPPAADLSFVLIGNLQRRFGGSMGRTLDGHQLEPTPDYTQYKVVDFSRRWDGWSNGDNWPGSADNGSAGSSGSADASAQLRLQGRGKWITHSNYQRNSISDPRNRVRTTVGNTTYLVGP